MRPDDATNKPDPATTKPISKTSDSPETSPFVIVDGKKELADGSGMIKESSR